MGELVNIPQVFIPANADIRIHIPDFVEKELRYFREQCNFTEDELEYFNLRAKGNSNICIAMKMNVSEAKVNKLSRKVKDKIIRVI